MSPKLCSLALDAEEESSVAEMEGNLRLVVNRQYVSICGSSADTSCDVIEFGGTITVSF